MSEAAGPDVLVRREGRAGRITLNRPKALNALSAAMVAPIREALESFAADPSVALVLVDAVGTRAFCAGGDIAEVYRHGTSGDEAHGRRFWREEYRLNARIARYGKPYVAIMDGIVMGGGVGLSAHGRHRVVTERSLVAMPECAIGLVPDVGGSWVLARAPGRLGEYLALTGARMGAADAILAGFADRFVPSERLDALKARLCETGDPAAIDAFAAEPPEGALAPLLPRIDALFGGETVPAILEALDAAPEPFAREAAEAIRRGSPVSLGATLRLVRGARAAPDIETALAAEYRFTHRAQGEGEFLEGVRAAVIDKDRTPRWRTGPVERFDEELADRMLAPLGSEEWRPDGREEQP